MASQSGKRLLCLITGGNCGLGFEVAKQLLCEGHHVVIACRDLTKGQAAVTKLKEISNDNENVDLLQLDLASFQSVRTCATEYLRRWDKLDRLICNAAVAPIKHQLTNDGFFEVFQVNHLSHFLLCHLLMPSIISTKDSRVVVVSSELHKSLGSLSPSPEHLVSANVPHNATALQIYGLSKLYNLWFMKSLSALLPPHTVCNAVTPGWVPATNLSRNAPYLARLAMQYILPLMPVAVSPHEGGRRITAVCLGQQEGSVTGAYFSKGKQSVSSADSTDESKAKELWTLSCDAVGITDFIPK